MKPVIILLCIAAIFASCGQRLGEERTVEGFVKNEVSGEKLDAILLSIFQGNGKEFPKERFIAESLLSEDDGSFSFTFEPYKTPEATGATMNAQAFILNELANGFVEVRLPIGATIIPIEDILEQPSGEIIIQDILTRPYGTLNLVINLAVSDPSSHELNVRVFNATFSQNITLVNMDLTNGFKFPIPLDEGFMIEYSGSSPGNSISGLDTLQIGGGMMEGLISIDL